jgi:hypothetical protein
MPGDRAYVRRADRTLVVFRVTAVHTYLKDHFPTAAVYGPVPGPQLRLITCGGAFDPAIGSYLANVVVYAVAAPGPARGHRAAHRGDRGHLGPRAPLTPLAATAAWRK